MWKAYENDGRIWVLCPGIPVPAPQNITPKEADDLIAQLSRIRHSQRNAVSGQIYELFVHHDGEIETAGYYAVVIRDGDKAELLRTKKFQSSHDAHGAADKLYGKAVTFSSGVKPDAVSFSAAEREQLLYAARAYAKEQGMTLKDLIKSLKEQEGEES